MKTKLFSVLLLLFVVTRLYAYDFDYIYDSAYYFRFHITNADMPYTVEVTSPDGGTYVIDSVVIPKTVTYNGITYNVTGIGSYAFSGCNSLISIAIPNSVTSIGSHAFSGCNSLESITIPNSVTSIESYAFEGCNSLISVSINSDILVSVSLMPIFGLQVT